MIAVFENLIHYLQRFRGLDSAHAEYENYDFTIYTEQNGNRVFHIIEKPAEEENNELEI